MAKKFRIKNIQNITQLGKAIYPITVADAVLVDEKQDVYLTDLLDEITGLSSIISDLEARIEVLEQAGED